MGKFLFLSFDDVVKTGVGIADLIETLEQVFRASKRGEVVSSKKVSTRLADREDAFLNSMPAYLQYKGVAGIKWVAGFPEAVRLGQPYITGSVILNDCNTGQPSAFMDATWITRERTAAISVLGVKYLKKAKCPNMGIIGCGELGRAHVFSSLGFFPEIKTVYCYDLFPKTAEKLAADVREIKGVEAIVCPDYKEALSMGDIIYTCTTPKEPFLSFNDVKEGATAVSIEGKQVWLSEDYARFDRLCVDEWHGIKEGAHVKNLVSGGFISDDQISAGLEELVNGQTVRSGDKEKVLMVTRGMGAEDVAIAHLIYERARALGLGMDLTLF